MSAKILEGKPLAEQFQARIAEEVAALKARGVKVCLATVQVGAKPESHVYVENQRKLCEKLGIEFLLEEVNADIKQSELIWCIESLNQNMNVHGIILQMPLPKGLDAQAARRTIDPMKDAEGVNPVNLGMILYEITQCAPCTALGAYELAKSSGVDFKGKDVVVIGHSQTVGRPLGLMLLHAEATVTTCHIHTKDLKAHTQKADIIFVGAGKPNLVTKEMVKPGAMVVDIGINYVPVLDKDGKPVVNAKGVAKTKMVGDADFEGVSQVAEWITPVPGGVGMLTTTMLLRNVVEAAKHSGNGLPENIRKLGRR